MFIGKITGSGITLNNENSASLASFTLDFALLRCNAPPEFSGVGSALTVKRKDEAEQGAIHQTAAKLGCLFQGMLPQTPKLISAFGKRVSEILAKPGINPKGTDNDGPFRDFIGAECTSIWAAATSGTASIAMLLLACLLARAWTDKEAVAIWVELIEERKRQLTVEAKTGIVIAGQQDYSRYELAQWDASTRAWLARADTAMHAHLTQLLLVYKNIHLPFRFSGSTFADVISPWIAAMEMMEALLDQRPQHLCSGVGLVAISAWHLFPDLAVFQDTATKVAFGDTFIPSASILSIGLELNGARGKMSQWSLALSHLRFYGDPVVVSSQYADHTRVRPEHLWLAVLGTIFRQWSVPYACYEGPLTWFSQLHKLLASDEYAKEGCSSWLMQLCQAAKSTENNSVPDSLSLVNYGFRYGKLLGDDASIPFKPFFGLHNPYAIDAVRVPQSEERSVSYLRVLANKLGLKPCEGIISSSDNECLASIAPVQLPTTGAGQGTIVQHMWWMQPEARFAPKARSSSGSRLKRLTARLRRAGEIIFYVDEEHSFSVHGRRLRWQCPPVCISSQPVSFGQVCTSGHYTFWVVTSTGLNIDEIASKALALGDETVSWPEACRFLCDCQARQCREDLYWALPTGSEPTSVTGPWKATFMLLEFAQKLYRKFHDATVSLCIIRQTLDLGDVLQILDVEAGEDAISLNAMAFKILEASFSVIVWMELGSFALNRTQMANVMAIAIKDRIYIAELMFRDPWMAEPCTEIRCVVGNVGHYGLTLLTSPRSPRSRAPGNNILDIRHIPYNNSPRDSFSGTTLHLSFTDRKVALDTEDSDAIDHNLFLLESVVSVQRCGKWVADIDVLKMHKAMFSDNDDLPDVLLIDEACPHRSLASNDARSGTSENLVTIDSWDELIDYPPSSAVLRAQNNWVARLAASCIYCQESKAVKETGKICASRLLLAKGEKLCLDCIQKYAAGGKRLLIVY